ALFLQVPAGSRVVMRGIDVDVPFGGDAEILVSQCQGSVWVEDCHGTANPAQSGSGLFGPEPGTVGADVYDSPDVSFVRCSLTGGEGAPKGNDPFHPYPATAGGAGLRASSSSVAIHECTLQGGKGGLGGVPAAASGAGLAASPGAQLLLAGGSATGGDKVSGT